MFKILFSCFFPNANVMLWKSRMMTVRPIPRKKVFARLSHDRISTAYNMKNTTVYATRPYSTILGFGFDGWWCPDQLISSSTSNTYPRKYFLAVCFQKSNSHQLCGTHEPTKLTLMIEENAYPRKFFLAAIPRIKPSSIVWNPRTDQANPRDWRKRVSKKVFSCGLIPKIKPS